MSDVRRGAAALLLCGILLACRASAPAPGGAAAPAAPPPLPTGLAVADAGCPAPRDYPFENLVLQGGGVVGIAYAGALEALEQQGILPRIRRVAGTSAGAITAALVALRYSPAEIRSILADLDFRRFKDAGGKLHGAEQLLRNFGIYRGEAFRDWLRGVIARKAGDPGLTFAGLRANPAFADLHVVATDLNRGASVEFSFDTTPELPVADAVRRSMSIPLFYEAVVAGETMYIDGGVMRNFPIRIFDPLADGSAPPNPRTLGLSLLHEHDTPRPIPGLEAYTHRLFDAMLSAQHEHLMRSPPDRDRTVFISAQGMRPTDFDLTREQQIRLIDGGLRDTCGYLSRWRSSS
jgi:NTE family protein